MMSEKHKNKISESVKAQWKNPKSKLNTYEKMTGEKNPFFGKHHSKESKQKMRNYAKNRVFTKIHKENMSRGIKKKWADPLHKSFQIRQIMRSRWKKPTSYELFIQKIVEKYNYTFEYVGNGKFLIEGKNPDFIDLKNKIALEVFYNYFKIQDYGSVESYKNERRKLFEEHGWKTIFIGDEEIFNEQLVCSKINTEVN